ncbi:MAG: hypothetical protein II147_00815 [Lachnospiraceae bacterium]|jgi:hypothetical protein|nr:hypothetical protein [Lachnospiraceae bacterium]MCR5344779.1 hypothetical protein [Lachnospiraceae bacterium]
MSDVSPEVLRKNPSRQDCESIIKRILVTEVLTKGKNEQFKNASDFMSYFESLFPASDALTKQVQRAIKAMMLPKDENGYLIINKTEEQLEEEKDLSYFLKRSNASLSSLNDCVPVMLHCKPEDVSYLMTLILKCITLKDKYETVIETADGILFYTRQEQTLRVLLDSLM